MQWPLLKGTIASHKARPVATPLHAAATSVIAHVDADTVTCATTLRFSRSTLTEDAENLRRVIAARDAQILNDMAVIGALRQALASIRDEFTRSYSWRLTHPVRMLGRLLDGLRPASP